MNHGNSLLPAQCLGLTVQWVRVPAVALAALPRWQCQSLMDVCMPDTILDNSHIRKFCSWLFGSGVKIEDSCMTVKTRMVHPFEMSSLPSLNFLIGAVHTDGQSQRSHCCPAFQRGAAHHSHCREYINRGVLALSQFQGNVCLLGAGGAECSLWSTDIYFWWREFVLYSG